MLREGVVVFLAGEPLLLGCGDQAAIAQKRRSSVMEVAGDAEDVHQNSSLELLSCPLHRSSFFIRLGAPPVRCTTLDGQGIAPPSNCQGEWSDKDEIEDS